jgi:trimethylamine--corrinoid protein Co-methyltransferase
MSTKGLIGSLPLLSQEEIENIHQTSLRILRETGVAVKHEEALTIFADSGAIVDKQKQVVFLPEKLVEEYRIKAPQEVSIEDRKGKRIVLKQGMQVLGGFSYILNIWNQEKSEPRRSKEEDVVNAVILQDALPAFKIIGPSAYANDAPEQLAELRTLGALISNTSKHCSVGCATFKAAQDWIALAKIVSKHSILRDHPIVGLSLSPVTPLTYNFDASAILLLAAREEIPATVLPMPLTGGTGPFTLAGSIALQNAELLLALVLSQLVSPGTPFIYGSSGCLLDMRTGNMAYAAPESLIIRGCSSQMARFYGLPSYAGLGPDALALDVQTGAERMMSYCAAFAAGITVVKGAGYIGPMTLSYEQLLIDHELWLMADRLFHGLDINQDTLAIEAIERVGIGGNYLKDGHTIEWLRREPQFHSKIIARPTFGKSGPGILTLAEKQVQDILANHKPEVSRDVITDIEEYVKMKSSEYMIGV